MIDDLRSVAIYGNDILAWTLAAALAVGLLTVMLVVRGFIAQRLRQRSGAAPEGRGAAGFTAGLVGKIIWPFLAVLAVFAGAYVLDLPPKVRGMLNAALIVVLFLQMAILGSYALTCWVERYERRAAGETAVRTTLGAVRFLGQVAIWAIALLLALDNLGFDITALMAGLGIGGIAVAFALQNILGDLFASVSIILDKPFEVGDFIIIGDTMGTVERVGIKTTRLRSLSGEQIVLANNDLLQSRIRNYKRMAERRVVFSIGVTYGTPIEKLEAIPGMLRRAVEAQESVRFDRAHFQKYGDSALVFEVVYFMLQPEYNLMMDTQQAINLAIFRDFAKDGIEFAYPTQTLFIHRLGNGAAEPAAA